MSNLSNIKFLFENLFVNKYDLNYAKRIASQTLQVNAIKKDEFGVGHHYEFLFFFEKVQPDYVKKFIKNDGISRLTVCVEKLDGISFTEEEFLDKLQTTIDPGIYLNPELEEIMKNLGHNNLPKNMIGSPPDLLEIYAKESLQFLVSGKGRRYGKERSFESLPDGAILGKDIVLLFDGKAYKDGYNPSADDIKRFASYVEDFNNKYSQFVGKVFSFVVLSGHFAVSEDALEERSRELYSRCQTALSFLSAERLAQFVKIALQNIHLKDSLNWKGIFSHPVPYNNLLTDQIDSLIKDKIK